MFTKNNQLSNFPQHEPKIVKYFVTPTSNGQMEIMLNQKRLTTRIFNHRSLEDRILPQEYQKQPNESNMKHYPVALAILY